MSEVDIKGIVEIHKTTKAGALIHVGDLKSFTKAVKQASNGADLIGSAEKLIAQKLEAGIDIKKIVDLNAKKLKEANENLRNFTVQYMQNEGIEKLEGNEEIKSITLQGEKEVEGVVNTEQIKLGKTYVDLKDVDKKALVEALEKLGVKTRIKTEKATSIKPASIRVQK